MRICIVTPEFWPFTRDAGGIGTQMATLAPALARAGHEVHVVTPAERGRAPIDGPIRHHRLWRPGLGRLFPLADPVLSAQLPLRLRSLGSFDVVLAPEYGGYARHYRPNGRGGPLITLLQTSLEQVLRMSPERVEWTTLRAQHRVQRWAERAQALRSDAIASCSRALLEWTERLWPLEGLTREVLPNVLDIARLRELAAADGGPSSEDEPTVGFSGRLESRKGVDVLVRAMSRVWTEMPDVQVAFAGRDIRHGDVLMSDRLRELAGSHAGRLRFLGALDPAALMPFLIRCELVATPSRWEAFGLATFEALALGVPTIATAAGGFADFLTSGEDAVLVPPDDPDALGEAILGLLRSPSRRRALGEAGARRAESFDVSNQLPTYVDFFERVAGD